MTLETPPSMATDAVYPGDERLAGESADFTLAPDEVARGALFGALGRPGLGDLGDSPLSGAALRAVDHQDTRRALTRHR